MRPVRYAWAATLAVSMVLGGCGPNDVDAYRQRDDIMVGSYAHRLGMLQASSRTGVCERRYAPLHQRIAKALDTRRDALERSFRESPRMSAPGRPFGPISLDERAVGDQDRVPTAIYSGWHQMEDYLAACEATDNWDYWQYLYVRTEGLLLDDMQRLQGLSMGLDAASLKHAEHIQQAVDACLAQPTCSKPVLTDEAYAYANDVNPIYKGILARAMQPGLLATQRQALRELAGQLSLDLSFFMTQANDSIQVQGRTLVVPLDAGPFADVRETLQSIIEDTWRTDDMAVAVRWVSRADYPNAYLFVAHKTVGRAYVRASDRTINLFLGTHRKVIAHEVGHVLGLPDRYFTVWREAFCNYEVRIDNQDIMSNHMTGMPTADAWASLKRIYEIGATP